MELKEKVKKMRALEKLSQQKLADMTRVTKGKISGLEYSGAVIGSDFLISVDQHPDLKKYAAWLVGIEATPPVNATFSDQDIEKMAPDQLTLLKQLIDSALDNKK